jgi:hypothetical protein
MRRTPLRRRRPTPRRSSRVRDVDYMVAAKRLPCFAAGLSPCEGAVEADHAGARGLGQKCSDREVLAICTGHHRARTDWSGPFREWTRGQMREWLAQGVAWTRVHVEALLRRPVTSA